MWKFQNMRQIWHQFNLDGFVKSPTFASRCIHRHCDVLYVRSLQDRRIADSSEFARLFIPPILCGGI